MGDRDFIRYCALHSTTDRALFNGEQVARLLRLAGDPYGNAAVWAKQPNTWRSLDLSRECDLAYSHTKEPT